MCNFNISIQSPKNILEELEEHIDRVTFKHKYCTCFIYLDVIET